MSSSNNPVSIVVVSSITPDDVVYDHDPTTKTPIIPDEDSRLDALDSFNHPRIRRPHILQGFQNRTSMSENVKVAYKRPVEKVKGSLVQLYQDTQSIALLEFFQNAWLKWTELGEAGRDPASSLKPEGASASSTSNIPALIPGNVPLCRDPHQRPSANVMGQIGYYCTDTCTPVFGQLLDELEWDASIVEQALEIILSTQTTQVVYALPTHPGHHAARESFGGYCYLNQAAHAAQRLRAVYKKVAILDIDYHCGNGTASIFYDRDDVLVSSIHCDPDHDYPFHSGFAEENATAKATFHVPLKPGATWDGEYQPALALALNQIFDVFGAEALVLSMGLDTLQGDPVTLRRAGFKLTAENYLPLGRLIGSKLASSSGGAAPCLVIQEGGYKFDELGQAAADVVTGIAEARQGSI